MGQDPNTPPPGQPQSPFGPGQPGPGQGGMPDYSNSFGGGQPFGAQSPQSAQGFGSSPTPPPPGPMPPGAPPMGPPGLPPNAPPPTKSGNKGLMIGLIVGGVVLLLVIALVLLLVVFRIGGSSPDDPTKATKASDAVLGYLTAVSEGDATKAKQYGLTDPGDSPLLTDSFLADAVSKNAITSIEVDENSGSGSSAYISATYMVGGNTVSANYEVTKKDNVWKLNQVVATDDRPSSWGTLDVQLNDTSVPSDGLALFPGVYELSTGTTLLEFETSDQEITVEQPSDYMAITATPKLSTAGSTAMIKASQDHLRKCLAQPVLVPTGCGSSFGSRLPSGVTMKPGTLSRTVATSGTPFATSTPRSTYGDPQTVTVSDYIRIAVTLTGSDGNSYKGSASVYKSTGVIKGETITVTFG